MCHDKTHARSRHALEKLKCFASESEKIPSRRGTEGSVRQGAARAVSFSAAGCLLGLPRELMKSHFWAFFPAPGLVAGSCVRSGGRAGLRVAGSALGTARIRREDNTALPPRPTAVRSSQSLPKNHQQHQVRKKCAHLKQASV